MTKDVMDKQASRPDSRASCGGVETAKPLSYSPPVGPKGQGHNSPGLGGDVHPKGTQRG